MVQGCGNPTAAQFLPAALGSPVLSDGACSLVGAQYEDQSFSFNNPTSPACFKILRKWTVIDWCQPLEEGRICYLDSYSRNQSCGQYSSISSSIGSNSKCRYI